MAAEQQTQVLADYILRECPHEIVGGGAGDVAILVIEKYRGALRKIASELGVPQPGYPAPAANAYEIAVAALGPAPA